MLRYAQHDIIFKQKRLARINFGAQTLREAGAESEAVTLSCCLRSYSLFIGEMGDAKSDITPHPMDTMETSSARFSSV